MNGKVTVIANIRAKPGREQEVKQALLGLCGPTLFLFHENWASKGDLEAHSQSPHLQAWRKRATELLVEPTRVTLWAEINGTATPS